VVLNTSTSDKPVQVTVDAAALGLPAGFGATTAADDKPLAVANGQLTVTVPARDFQMVVLK
jgi:hypothetical protein